MGVVWGACSAAATSSPAGDSGSGGTQGVTAGGTGGTGSSPLQQSTLAGPGGAPVDPSGAGGAQGGGGAASGNGGSQGSGATGTLTGGATGTLASGSGGGSSASSGNGGASGGASGGAGGAPASGSGAGGGVVGCVTDADCSDGTFCNGVETCNQGECVEGGPPCDDGLPCTVDACDEAADGCSHAPSDALCDNGVACDGAETCSAVLGCLSGPPASCDDAIGCTSDFCDPGTGQCAHVPQDGPCQDGVFCNGVEACDPLTGDPFTGCAAGAPIACADGIPCTDDFCSEATHACVHIGQAALCDDGDWCNGVEGCTPGFGCSAGTPVSCDDGRTCTADACDSDLAECVHVPLHALCSDGLDCNGVEQCSSNGPAPTGCVAGTPIPCPSDGIACTVEACNEATNQCVHTPTNAVCGAGELCVPAAGGCTASPPCQTDAQCNDGNPCNGVETCNVVCQSGAPIDCNDGIDCTIDSCYAFNGTCVHAPNNALCDDGLKCNGVEACSAQSGCVAGTPKVCDDGIDCTADSCAEPFGACEHALVDALCSDGHQCNGAEVCTPTGCAPGTPFVCPPDGVACTQEVCDAATDSCVAVPDNSLCPCGQTCDPAQGGCGSFCTVATCQGKVYACGDCLDNDGDCAIDSADSQCLGPCDDTEDSFYGGIPGQNNSPCKSDCYFDQDTGSGNDDCYWSHKCDLLETPPNYPPEGSQCAYNPNANIPGYGGSCAGAFSAQSATCASYCGPLTPNGCDCFGCCAIPGAPTTVWLGSESPPGAGSCTLADLANPLKCKPCTQVPACLNTCEHCEICIGKPTLPADCAVQDCPPGTALCGGSGQEPCPSGYTCITGCCQANPE